MTPNDVIYQRRVALLAEAERSGNVAETCRRFGVSRTRYYEWKARAELYGLAALMPKERRRPQMSGATPTHVLEELLSLAVSRPTLGARQFADALLERGFVLGKSSVQRHLVANGLGTRARRLARAAAIVAATTGLSTEAAREETPFGFCLFSPGPGHLVAVDGFYIGNLKGVGKVYQLTAVDVFSRFAFAWIIAGVPNAQMAVAFLARIQRQLRAQGTTVRAVLSDNGPEWVSSDFRGVLAAQGIDHVRIPPRSPNHNAVVERFHQTMLNECWRPAFHRRSFHSVKQLQAEADAWLLTYNFLRKNHGDYMRGRIPGDMMDPRKKAA